MQGSNTGTTFWNILLDPLLSDLQSNGTYCQAFADDIVLVVSETSATEIECQADRIRTEVSEWGKTNKLRFAAHKTNAMIITQKLKYDTPRIPMSANPIKWLMK